eukprot:TRINITY_DN554_c0_g1_i3.p1 TRINITY_DN554_c0_g1~~TRINITY_DN554_c0_g1_i3.p1  ORF type:complete len:457 (+),score=102.68 TRINITY_DN554_c0_g1_i3:435-1805(+)
MTLLSFLQLVQPCANKRKRVVTIQRECSNEVRFALAQVLFRVAEVQRAIEEQKAVMDRYPKKELYKLFKEITGRASQHIDKQEISNYMAKSEVYTTDEDVRRIIRRLDRDRDGKVSYIEFLDAFSLENIEVDDKTVSEWEKEIAAECKVIEELKEQLQEFNIPKEISKKNIGIDMYTQTENKEKDASKLSLDESSKSESPKTIPKMASFIETPAKNPKDSFLAKSADKSKPSPSFTTPFRSPNNLMASAPTAATSYYRAPVLSLETPINPTLTAVLKTQLEIASEVEDVKARLWLRHDFNVVEAFRFFDCRGFGSVTVYELKKAVKRLGLNFREDELQLLMKRHDQDRDGKLSIAEFERMVRPIGYTPLSSHTEFPSHAEAKTTSSELKFSTATIEVMSSVIQKLVQSEAETEELRREVIRKCRADKFNIINAFRRLDNLKRGYILLTGVFLLYPQ